MKKTPGDIIILHTHLYEKSWSHDAPFLRYGAQQTDRWNGQVDRKSDI